MIQDYIGKKAVSQIVDTGKKTPMGGIILKIHFEDGTYEYMPEKRFNIVKTKEPTDLNYIRGMVKSHASKDIGQVVYGLLIEFGCKLSEIDSITNQVIVMTNSHAEHVNNLLWGVEYADERTLNMINDLLIEHVSKNGKNGSPPDGAGIDPANTK